MKQKFICFYCYWILFIRSFFIKENPTFIFIISLLYPVYTLIMPTDINYDAFIQMRLLLSVGIYLISIDSLGSYISEIIINNKYPYLTEFFNNQKSTSYFQAGWSTLIIGKTPMTSTGRAAIVAAFVSGGIFFYQGHLQRTYEAEQANKQRTHETEQDAKKRAYNNYQDAQKDYSSKRFYQTKGEKPHWDESKWEKWSNTK